MTSPAAPAASGPGTLAGIGPRLLAFVIDAICADVVAIIFGGGYHPGARQNLYTFLAFLAIELVFVAAAGQTPGMWAAGVAVVRADGSRRLAPQWVAVRTVLIATIVPALIADKTGRWMHDRAVGAVMLRTR